MSRDASRKYPTAIPLGTSRYAGFLLQRTFLSFSEPSVRRIPLACMWRYRIFCRADMSHLITYSTWRKNSKQVRAGERRCHSKMIVETRVWCHSWKLQDTFFPSLDSQGRVGLGYWRKSWSSLLKVPL